MYVYALFDNETAELVTIRFLNAAVDKLLDIYLHSFQSPKVQESAKRGIQCAHELIFSQEIKKYYQTSPISVTLKDFNQQVEGSSAGLAYALAFAVALKNRNIINWQTAFPNKIAATGELDVYGNVLKIKNIKQKIIAAINEDVKLVLYPGQNFDELKQLRQSDPDLENAIKRSGIILKHVSTLKQAFCELGLFQKTMISIESICSSESNSIISTISLTNDIQLDIKSFDLLIKYDSRLKIEKTLPSDVTAINKMIKYSTGKDNTLHLTFNTENDISSLLSVSTELFKIEFLLIQEYIDEINYEVNFVEKGCTINNDPIEQIGGICFNSDFKSRYTSIVNNTDTSNRNIAINFLVKNKKKCILAGILFPCISVIFYTLLAWTSNGTKVHEGIKPSSASINQSVIEPEPSKIRLTTTPVLVTTPLTVTSETPSVVPSPTQTTMTITNKVTPTPLFTAAASTNQSSSKSPEISPSTPSNSPAKLNLLNFNDFTTWKVKNINSESSLSSVEGYLADKAVRIDYNIKGNGSVSIQTKPNAIKIPQNKFKKLRFNYKRICETRSSDTINIKINSSFNTYVISTTNDIPENDKWIKKEYDISGIKSITSVEVFIGCLTSSASTETSDKGSLILCNFMLLP